MIRPRGHLKQRARLVRREQREESANQESTTGRTIPLLARPRDRSALVTALKGRLETIFESVDCGKSSALGASVSTAKMDGFSELKFILISKIKSES